MWFLTQLEESERSWDGKKRLIRDIAMPINLPVGVWESKIRWNCKERTCKESGRREFDVSIKQKEIGDNYKHSW